MGEAGGLHPLLRGAWFWTIQRSPVGRSPLEYDRSAIYEAGEAVGRILYRSEKGERVLLDMIDVPDDFTIELMRATRSGGGRAAGGSTPNPHQPGNSARDVFGTCRPPSGTSEMFRMKRMQAYIAIRGSENATNNADEASEQTGALLQRPCAQSSITGSRKPAGACCAGRPRHGPAAGMSTEAFENFYFNVCTLDYRKMARAMVPLERWMKTADRVHIKGPGTDLTFSIKGIGAKMCKAIATFPTAKSSPAR